MSEIMSKIKQIEDKKSQLENEISLYNRELIKLKNEKNWYYFKNWALVIDWYETFPFGYYDNFKQWKHYIFWYNYVEFNSGVANTGGYLRGVYVKYKWRYFKGSVANTDYNSAYVRLRKEVEKIDIPKALLSVMELIGSQRSKTIIKIYN